jgi:AraC-like DNA-binding protein
MDDASAVEVLWIARYDYEAGWRVERHSHRFFQMIVAIDGSATIELGPSKVILHIDDVLLITPGTPHALRADLGEPLKTLDTKFRVNDLEIAGALRGIRVPVNDQGQRVRQRLERVRIEGIQRRSWHRHVCNALLLDAVVALARMDLSGKPEEEDLKSIVPQTSDPIVAQIMELMEERFAEPWGVREFAEKIGYTAEYLTKRCTRSTGLSLHQLLMRTRVRKARELLADPERPIKDIAFSVGFKSVHHFTRVFREVAGSPPATWRRREKEGIWRNVPIEPGFVNRDLTIRDR